MEEYVWKSVIWHVEDVPKVSPSTLSYNGCDIWLACAGMDLVVTDIVSLSDSKD